METSKRWGVRIYDRLWSAFDGLEEATGYRDCLVDDEGIGADAVTIVDLRAEGVIPHQLDPYCFAEYYRDYRRCGGDHWAALWCVLSYLPIRYSCKWEYPF
jgi:hypothetical protein